MIVIPINGVRSYPTETETAVALPAQGRDSRGSYSQVTRSPGPHPRPQPANTALPAPQSQLEERS